MHSDVQVLEIETESDMEHITQRVCSNVHRLTFHVGGIEQRSNRIVMHWCVAASTWDAHLLFTVLRRTPELLGGSVFHFAEVYACQVCRAIRINPVSVASQSRRYDASHFWVYHFSFIVVILVTPNPASQPAEVKCERVTSLTALRTLSPMISI